MGHYGEGDIENRVRADVRRAFEKYEAPAALAEVIALLPKLEWHNFPDRTEGGKPHQTAANARHVLNALPIEFKYNQFRGQPEIGGHKLQQFHGNMSDDACLMLRMFCKKHFGFEPSATNMRDAVIQLCLDNRFDPVRNYLNGLEWDGKKRLGTWMINYLGAEDTELTREIGRLVLLAGVRRALYPGTKFDQIVVLEGPEGINKSTAVLTLARAVGDEYFSDQRVLDVEEKMQQELLHGKWIYECADLSGLKRAEVEKVKAFCSRTHDRARAACGHFVTEQPRRCIFFATTNESEYLQSETGNRRFWPITTCGIDINRLAQDRDQLWAEAVHEEAKGGSIMLAEQFWPLAAAEQAKRLVHDEWDDLLDAMGANIGATQLENGTWEQRVSSADLMTVHLKLSAAQVTRDTSKRLKRAMMRLGWRHKKGIRFGNGVLHGYTRPIETPITI
jgi:predicted P-loop ATPase